MSGIALGAPTVGFFGKLPSRGDFVRAGLPRGFVDPWDAWLQAVLPASRMALGSRWHDAWMVAPVWRFALAPGVCGPDAAVGVLMPSVDRAGRHFPLTIALLGTADVADAWLDFAETTGRDALEHGWTPDLLAEWLGAFRQPDAMANPGSASPGNRWWSDGSPFVPATQFTCADLPGARTFTAMLATREAAQ